jgi:ElaB/YqjD/DUF883 family membrane-anchored ribosome-binding protein
MSRSRDRDRTSDDLASLLDELRATLDDLERTLDDDGRAPDRRRRSSAPSGGDVVRFTEEYTIPTVISVLETTIQSLELLRGVLRLADPDRRFRSDRDGSRGRLDGVDRRVVDGTERALDELRQVLTGTEEPSDPTARDVFTEARELTAEIESILEEARGDGRSSRAGRRRRGAGDDRREARSVVIPVDDADGGSESSAGTAETEPDTEDPVPSEDTDSGVEVDVDAELDSIREEVRRESERTNGVDDGSAESGGSAENDDSASGS